MIVFGCAISAGACGISKYPDAGEQFLAPRIVGGEYAEPNEFPWQVSYTGPQNKPGCINFYCGKFPMYGCSNKTAF